MNELENFTIEIIRPYVKPFSLMLIALSAEKEEGKLASILNLTEQFIRLCMLKRTDGVITSNRAITSNMKAIVKAKLDLDFIPEKSFVLWMSNNQLIYLDNKEIAYHEVSGGKRQPCVKAPFDEASLDLKYTVEGGSDWGSSLGLGLGLLGAVIGSVIGSSRQLKYFYCRSELNIGSKHRVIYGMQPSDAVMFRFVMAASAI